jgi:hypothetical protein
MTSLDSFFHNAPLLLVALVLLVLMAASYETGSWAWRRLAKAPGDHETNDEGYIVSAVLGLLALLIAFCFGLALNRFEARRDLVVTEANAIGTAYLRTALLDDPKPLQAEMRRYVEARLDYGNARSEARQRLLQQSIALQPGIWRTATDAVRPYRTSPLAPLVLAPINKAFDAASSRTAALAARLPASVLAMLSLYAVIAAAVLGYAIAGAQGRHRLASLTLFALLALAIILILDLDRPRSGSIMVSQQPMIDTLAGMK